MRLPRDDVLAFRYDPPPSPTHRIVQGIYNMPATVGLDENLDHDE